MREFILSFAQGVRGKKTQTEYSTQAEITSLDELKRAVLFDHVAGLFKKNYRSNKTFIYADCLIMDCDNDNENTKDPSSWLTPEKLSERLKDVEFAVVYSKSHMKNKDEYSPRPRFHAYFPLSEFVKEAETISAMKNRIIALVPEFDDGAKDAARFIFGVENPQGKFFEGSLCVDQFLAQHEEPSFDYEVTEIPHDELIKSLDGAITMPEEENVNENDADIIPNGQRNTTLYRTACRLIRKHGELNAIQPFNVACSKCKPPLPPAEIAQIWDKALKFVRSEIKKEQKKKKSQSEDERLCAIRDSFLKGKHIFFNGTIEHGEFFRYSEAGYWCKLTNAKLRAEISDYLGHKNSKDVGKILTMIRDMVYREMPEWNKGRIDNFPNGTLELDTGNFREHRPEDYLTFSHTFNYNPAAIDCSTYDAFMSAITSCQQSRIDHLTDLMAYSLYEDNRLEKLFFLIGNGANGKGTFLHLVEDLFSNANPCQAFDSVSHVQPCDMDEATKRIALEGALLNIAYDIEKNLRGCSSYLKSLAGNDTITGNRKFCDIVSFTSRAKVISSCNHVPIIDDDSYGMRRKLCFIRFEAKFDEGTADTHMRDKLQAELPAIYNRFYRAYQELRKREELCGQDAIRLSCDQPGLMKAFTVFADPVRDFWRTVKEKYLSSGEIRKPEVYEDFRHFAERNNIDLVREGMREKTFHAKFFAVLREDSDISADNSLRRREGEGGKIQVYYYSIKQKPEASAPMKETEEKAPAHDESTQPEVTETPHDDDTPAVIEDMTEEADSKQQEDTEPPAPLEHVPTPSEDAQTLERLFSGEKIECD